MQITRQQSSGPDERWAVVNQHHEPLAALSLWTNSVPTILGRRLGVIGEYSADDREAAATLISHALERLRARGADLAIGPMDRDTWHGYRFTIDGEGAAPPFFLEPQNPPYYPSDFERAGFRIFAQYLSSVETDLTRVDKRAERIEKIAITNGVRVRELNIERFEEEMRFIYDLSLKAFAGNLLYTPIGFDEFLAMYAKVKNYIDPRLCLIAEDEQETFGFVFAIPNLVERPIRSVIVKTLARNPGRRYAGIGALLTQRIRARIAELGYECAIHALMHESNVSAALSGRFGTVLRRYALFSKDL